MRVNLSSSINQAKVNNINKPFIVLLNSEHPDSSDTKNLASSLCQKYGATVIPINCVELNMQDFFI